MRLPRILTTALLLLAALAGPAATADEADDLRRELERARQRIQQLEGENALLRGAAPAVPPAAVATPGLVAVPAAGVTPATFTLVTLPPLAEGEVVTLDRLFADFRQSQLAADTRYRGRTLRVRGTVERIAKVFAMMQFEVTLRGEDPVGRAQANVTFPGISNVRLTPNGRELHGSRPFKAEQLLLRTDDVFEFEGEFEGLEGGVLRFRKARPVPAS